MTLPYRTTCLVDGQVLLPIVLDPHSAPWWCLRCRHQYWVAELTEDARKLFRPSVEDFGYGAPLQLLQDLVAREHDEAIARGTSCREDQLAYIPYVGLQRMKHDPRIHPDFRAKVDLEAARKAPA